MSIAVGAHTTAVTPAPATSVTTSAQAAAASGSTFVVFVGHDVAGGPVPVITDSKSNTYTQIQSQVDSGLGYYGSLWFCPNAVGGSGVTATATFGATGDLGIWFVEVTGGLAASGILDQAPAGLFTNPGVAGTFVSNTTGLTSQAAELLLAFTVTNSHSGFGNVETLTWGNGFTQLDAETNTHLITGGSAFQITTTPGTFQASFTSSGGNTADAIAFIGSFKALGSAAVEALFFGAGTTS